MAIWGIRLGSFLIRREFNSNYTKAVKTQTDTSQNQSIFVKFSIWIGVSLLYACMFSPVVFSFQAPNTLFGSAYLWIVYLGVFIMALGFLIESISDYQKSNFKKVNPKLFCDVGLFSWVRCPNYLGEIMVWLGSFIVAINFMHDWWQWVISVIGFVCIVLIMMGSTKRLERKQEERYGKDVRFQEYVKKVPILFPWVPIYSLKNVKVYLE